VLSMSLRNLRSVHVGGRVVDEGGTSRHPLAAEASARLHADLPALTARVGHPR